MRSSVMTSAAATGRRLLRIHQHHQALLPSASSTLLLFWEPPALVTSSFFTNGGGSSSSRYMSSSATAAQQQNPPNLRIDPRSSFYAPATSKPRRVYDNLPTREEEEEEDPLDEMEKSSNSKDELDEYDDDDDNDADWQTSLATPEPTYAIPLPDRLHVDIYTLFAPDHSNHVGTIWLDESVFGQSEIRVDLLKRSVDYYRAKKRGRRTAVTKTISEVSGSGRKVRPQKGTGQARMGHSRPPHHRGGAKAHGPKNTTDYGKTKLNRKVRRAAVRHALSQKLLEGNLIILNQLHELPTHKTGDLVRLLEPWEIGGRYGTSALILDHYHHDETDNDTDNNEQQQQQQEQQPSFKGVPIRLWVASSNLHQVTVGNDHAANVYNILKHEKLVLTLSALEVLESRLQGEVY